MDDAAVPARPEPEYVGFWKRFVAFLIDSFVLLVVVVPLLAMVYGWGYFEADHTGFAGPWDFIVQVVLPFAAAVLFWKYRGATPGKMAISAKIVDAATLSEPSTRQLIVRYFAYFVSCITLMIGFAWIGIDRRKQGFHDKIAGTLVVHDKEGK